MRAQETNFTTDMLCSSRILNERGFDPIIGDGLRIPRFTWVLIFRIGGGVLPTYVADHKLGMIGVVRVVRWCLADAGRSSVDGLAEVSRKA